MRKLQAYSCGKCYRGTVEVVTESNKYGIIDPNLSIPRKKTRCPLARSTLDLILTRYIGTIPILYRTDGFGEAF